MNNFEKVYTITSRIPKGKVLTYGLLAKLAGLKSPRVVGNILHKNPTPVKVPCHRVVNREGKLAKNFGFGGLQMQRKLLMDEGVQFISTDKVDLEAALWSVD